MQKHLKIGKNGSDRLLVPVSPWLRQSSGRAWCYIAFNAQKITLHFLSLTQFQLAGNSSTTAEHTAHTTWLLILSLKCEGWYLTNINTKQRTYECLPLFFSACLHFLAAHSNTFCSQWYRCKAEVIHGTPPQASLCFLFALVRGYRVHFFLYF